MESYYLNNFEVKPKHSSEAALQRWRKLCGFVKNPKRRFRFTANLSKRYEAQAIRCICHQEKLRDAVLVSKAAFQFIHGMRPSDYAVPEEEVAGSGIFDEELGSIVENPSTSTINGLTSAGSLPSDYAVSEEEVAGSGIFDEELGSIVENPSTSTINGLTSAGLLPSDYAVPEEEVAGSGIFDEELGPIVENPSTSTINGPTTDSDSLNRRREIFGINLESVGKYFREATTAVLVLCALIGSFTRVKNLLSFFKGLSRESACIPPLRWGGIWNPPSCERDETYTGYIRYFIQE